MTTFYRDIDSPWGVLRLSGDGQALRGCHFLGQKYFPALGADWRMQPGDGVLVKTVDLLGHYFRTGRLTAGVPLKPGGTPFQQQVWAMLQRIPNGETASYGEVAAALGRPTAARAVAAAIGRNPISLLIPCHRVLGARGELTGYAGGVERKAALLALEGATRAAGQTSSQFSESPAGV